MHYVCRSFLGHLDDLSWSQYWENESDDPSLTLHRGHLFALVNLSVVDGLASDIGHLLINEVNQIYFSSIDVPAVAWLKRTLETINQNPIFKVPDLSLMVAVVLDGYLHLCFLNGGVGIFHRGTKISQVISGTDDQVQQISGKLLSADQFLLCTPAFLNNYTFAKIKTYLSGVTISDIEESFLLDLNSMEDQSLVAGLLVQVHQESSETVIAEVATVTPPSVHDSSSPHPVKASESGLSGEGIGGRFKKLFNPRPVYVSHLATDSVNKRKKINIIFSVLILLALFISIYFGAKRNHAQQVENKYQNLKSQYQTKINNALAIKNISLDESQKEAQASKDILHQMSLLKVHSEEISQFAGSTDSLLSQTGSADVYKPVSFYDTTLIGGQAHYSQMFFNKNKLYLLDGDSGRIDSLHVGNRSLQKILPANANGSLAALAEDNGTVYVLKNNSIFTVSGQTLVKKVDLGQEIDNFQSGSFRFWNGSLYILAQLTDGSSTIWKFTPNSTGFGAGSQWVKNPKTMPASATSFAINGQVWVIGQNGQIVPFTRGIPDTYKSVATLTSAANLVTAVDSEVLAYTEKDNLVYVNHKTNPTVAAYNFDKRQILSLALDGPTKTIFVLCDDQKIYKISL